MTCRYGWNTGVRAKRRFIAPGTPAESLDLPESAQAWIAGPRSQSLQNLPIDFQRLMNGVAVVRGRELWLRAAALRV